MAIWRVSIVCAWKCNDIQIVEEDPEYFFGHVSDFFAPDTVGTRTSHIKNEADWALGLVGLLDPGGIIIEFWLDWNDRIEVLI